MLCWLSLFKATGTVLTINTKQKLYNGDTELIDIAKAFTPQKWSSLKLEDRMRLFWKKLQTLHENIGM
jgi:aconitate hydratase 2/2-methylisocitrate dehydratase